MPCEKSPWKTVRTNPRKTTNASKLSGIKVRLFQPGKEARPAEVLAEEKGNIKWVMEAGTDKYNSYKKCTIILHT